MSDELLPMYVVEVVYVVSADLGSGESSIRAIFATQDDAERDAETRRAPGRPRYVVEAWAVSPAAGVPT